MKGSTPATRKLWMMAAIVAIALTPLIGIRNCRGPRLESFGGGGFHGGGFYSGGFHDRGFHDRRAFRGFRLGYGGFLGGYYPGYYGYRTCYLTVYGTTACY